MSKLAESAGVVTLAGCFISVIAIPLIIVDIGWMGFVTMKVWNWFLPSIQGIPEISFAQAAGLRMVWLCFNRSAPDKDVGPEATAEQNNAYLASMLAFLFLSPLFILFLAYMVKSFLF